MQLADIVNQLTLRAQTMNLTDSQTGFIDRDEIALYLVQSIRYLANRYQLQHFIEIDRHLLQTAAGTEDYEIPANYGFWYPQETYKSGMVITEVNGTSPYNLVYRDLAWFNLMHNQANTGKPVSFTLEGGRIRFFPIPDAVYTIQALTRPSQENVTEIPDPYVEAAKVETLYRMAGDREKLTPQLQDERQEILRTLVNGESRTRQRFYTSRERIGLGRYRRYTR